MSLPPASWIHTCSETEFRHLAATTPATERARLFALRAQVDVTLFARQALGHHLRLPFAPFHRTLFAWHRRMGAHALPHRAGLRFALAAPRGHAKSTVVSLLLVLHDLVYARERYILLLSATQRQAQQRLRAIRAELAGDTPLVRWFPHLLHRVGATNRTLEANSVRIEAFGAGAEMRGVSFDSWRPTKIVLDDVESSAAAESARRRRALHDWFAEVVEHLGAPYTHLLAIGTVLHPKGLLATLLDRADFESLHCRALERFPAPSPEWQQWRSLLTDHAVPDRRESARAHFLAHRETMTADARTLWPEHEDCEHLMTQLVVQGRRAFFQEKQNEPLGPEEALFDPETAWRARRRPDGTVELLAPGAVTAAIVIARGDLRLFAYHDAALGKRRAAGAGDFAALAAVGLAPDGRLVALSLWVRRAPASAQVAALFDMHEALGFERLGIEGTGFQELLTLPIEEERRRRARAGRRADLPVEVIHPRRRKEARIAALEPLLASGRLALAEDLPEEFWIELARYPRTEHDDALDALAGAVELANEWGPRTGTVTFTRARSQRPRSSF
ncbi:MAG: hypothetical protein KF858_05235 [Candidatus Sumerlaeia bacterium]|nr:hypothetical protein [Candidatus Sumerlaeia bacterium]